MYITDVNQFSIPTDPNSRPEFQADFVRATQGTKPFGIQAASQVSLLSTLPYNIKDDREAICTS